MEPKRLSNVLLVVKPECCAASAAWARLLREAGYRVNAAGTLPEQVDAPLTLVVCHLRSTLTDLRDVAGYREFLHTYAHHPRRGSMRLVVIQPRIEDGPDQIIGYAALVDAYVMEDCVAEYLPGFLRRLEQSTAEGAPAGEAQR